LSGRGTDIAKRRQDAIAHGPARKTYAETCARSADSSSSGWPTIGRVQLWLLDCPPENTQLLAKEEELHLTVAAAQLQYEQATRKRRQP
jgi:hypothetical protein